MAFMALGLIISLRVTREMKEREQRRKNFIEESKSRRRSRCFKLP